MTLRLEVMLVCIFVMVTAGILAWRGYHNLSVERDQLLLDNSSLMSKVVQLNASIDKLQADHNSQIASITEFDRKKNAVGAVIAPLVKASDLLVYSKDQPDASPDQFVRDLNALNGNLVRLLDENSR